MYQNKKYKKCDKDFTVQLIEQYPFATLVTSGNELLATHIPVLIKEEEDHFCLYGHIANHNEQIHDIVTGEKALLLFKGPDAYVSSSWYTKADISTWDYSAVHIRCSIKVQTTDELIASLKKLVFHFEKDKSNPRFYQDLPEKLIQDHLQKITGFWLYPERIKGIAKFHQGFKKKDISAIADALENKDDTQAQEVSQQIKNNYATNN